MRTTFILPKQFIVFDIQQDGLSYYFMLNTACSHSFAHTLKVIPSHLSPTGREITCHPAPFSLNAWSEQTGIPLQGMIGRYDFMQGSSIAFDWDQRSCYIDEIPPFMLDLDSTHDTYPLQQGLCALSIEIDHILPISSALLDSSSHGVHIPKELRPIDHPQWSIKHTFTAPSFDGLIYINTYGNHSISLHQKQQQFEYPVTSDLPDGLPALLGLSYWVKHNICFNWTQHTLYAVAQSSTQSYWNVSDYTHQLPFQITLPHEQFYTDLILESWQDSSHAADHILYFKPFGLHIHDTICAQHIPPLIYQVYGHSNLPIHDGIHPMEMINELISHLYQQWTTHSYLDLWSLHGACRLSYNKEQKLYLSYEST